MVPKIQDGEKMGVNKPMGDVMMALSITFAMAGYAYKLIYIYIFFKDCIGV